MLLFLVSSCHSLPSLSLPVASLPLLPPITTVAVLRLRTSAEDQISHCYISSKPSRQLVEQHLFSLTALYVAPLVIYSSLTLKNKTQNPKFLFLPRQTKILIFFFISKITQLFMAFLRISERYKTWVEPLRPEIRNIFHFLKRWKRKILCPRVRAISSYNPRAVVHFLCSLQVKRFTRHLTKACS